MTQKQKNIVMHRLDRARESLSAARILQDNRHYVGAVNRLYYACFYATTALLETRGLASSKHSGVLSLFNRQFVKTGIISTKWGKFYGDLFDTRHEGDYADFPKFASNEIDELHQAAASFVEELAQVIEKEIVE